jgi:transcriptional regulator GlxA family with amidase domain
MKLLFLFCFAVTFGYAQDGAKKNVAVFLYDHAILFDYAPASELFRVAGKMTAFNVFSVGKEIKDLPHMDNIVSIKPQYSFENAPKIDVLIVGGGMWPTLKKDTIVHRWLRGLKKNGTIILGICTGVYVLGPAGILDGMKATSLHVQLDQLKKLAPKAEVVKEQYVDNGQIITTAGAYAGIAASLHLIGRLTSKEEEKYLADVYLDYHDYKP